MTPSTVDRVQIKVCGITTPEEAKACVDLGADMIGINCWEPSPRYVSKEKLSAITDLIDDHEKQERIPLIPALPFERFG